MSCTNYNWNDTVLKCKESYTVTYKKFNEKEEKEEVTEVLTYMGKSTLYTTVEGVKYTMITTKWNNDIQISGTDIINIAQPAKGGRRCLRKTKRTRRHRTKRSHTRK